MDTRKKVASSTTNLHQDRGKDSKFLTESQATFDILHHGKPMTRYEIAKALGVERANICRYVGHMLKDGIVQVHHVGVCPISHYPNVQFLTSNPALFPKERQLSLFDILWKGVRR